MILRHCNIQTLKDGIELWIFRCICVYNAIYLCTKCHWGYIGFPITVQLLLFTMTYYHVKCTWKSLLTFLYCVSAMHWNSKKCFYESAKKFWYWILQQLRTFQCWAKRSFLWEEKHVISKSFFEQHICKLWFFK